MSVEKSKGFPAASSEQMLSWGWCGADDVGCGEDLAAAVCVW